MAKALPRQIPESPEKCIAKYLVIVLNFDVNMAPEASLQHRLQYAPAGWVVSTATLGVFAYSLWVLSSRFDPQMENSASSLALAALELLCIILGLCISRQKKFDRRLRTGWFLLTLGIASNLLAEILWFHLETNLKVDPFPSLPDLFYLLYYPLTMLGLLLLPFAPVSRRERTTLWLDLAIVMVTGSMACWYFILAPFSLTAGQGLAGSVAIAYPVADLLLLAGVLALIQRDVEKVARWTLFFLAASMLSQSVSDGLFAYLEIQHLPYQMAYLNIGWLSANLFYLYAGFQQITSSDRSGSNQWLFYRSHRLLRVALPYLSVLAGAGLLYILMQGFPLPDRRFPGVFFGLFLLVGLVLLRQYVVLRENLQLYLEMKKMASTDSLTGLYNRHFFNEFFRLKIEHAKRYQEPLSVMLIDINGFKKINDRHGHLQGDAVLKAVAQLLVAQLRSADLVARFGGDEFVIVMPETGLESAQLVAERLKNLASPQQVSKIPVSLSVGLAGYQAGLSPEQLLETADQDLYRQKSQVHETPVAGNLPGIAEAEHSLNVLKSN